MKKENFDTLVDEMCNTLMMNPDAKCREIIKEYCADNNLPFPSDKVCFEVFLEVNKKYKEWGPAND